MKSTSSENNELLLTLCSSCCGKVIISGEHSVVYGKPAIAFGINKYTKMYLSCYKSDNDCFILVNLLSLKKSFSITKQEIINNNSSDNNIFIHKKHFMHIINIIIQKVKSIISFQNINSYINNHYFIISISSEILVGFGLGSSGAYNVCIVNGICSMINNIIGKKIFGVKDILLLSNEGEKIFHNGTPSGIDVSCSLYGGIINFNTINAQFNMEIPENNFFLTKIRFLLINTKIQRNGGELIKAVKQFKDNNISLFNELIEEISKLTNEIKKLLMLSETCEKDIKNFFELIKKNQLLLKKICVSNKEIDKIVDILEKNGFVGKISGAGGGGCIISFCLKDDYEKLKDLLGKNKIEYIDIKISKDPAKLINYNVFKI